jgi:cobalt-precorrin-5B (C1)-methyltransferase
VEVTLPRSKKPYSGKRVRIPVEYSRREGEYAEAGIRKDAGDDEDVTNHALIVARTRRKEEPGISIIGGEGVGVVTRSGMRVPRGEAAINPTPREMILRECSPFLHGKSPNENTPKDGEEGRVKKGRTAVNSPDMGLEIEISVPQGRFLAKKTWNPRIGIEGGISILGNSGVVEPRSSKAWMASLATLIKASAETGQRGIIVIPGFVGERFLQGNNIRDEFGVAVGDYVGFAFRQLSHWGFREAIFAAHISKAAKVAAGLMNTHAKYGDARLETVAAAAAAAGAPKELVMKLLELKLAEESIKLILDAGYGNAFSFIARRAAERLKEEVTGDCSTGCIVLDIQGEPLGAHPPELMGEEKWQQFR